jgi:hypothetical protein
VEIPVNLKAPWADMVIGGDQDVAVEKMAHVAHTAVCEQRLMDTADMPIALFPILDQDEPAWRQRLEAACDLT